MTQDNNLKELKQTQKLLQKLIVADLETPIHNEIVRARDHLFQAEMKIKQNLGLLIRI